MMKSQSAGSMPWILALSAVVVLSGGAIAIVATHSEDNPESTMTAPVFAGSDDAQLIDGVPAAIRTTKFAMMQPPPAPVPESVFHSVWFGTENGVRVVKVQLRPQSEVVTLDAATGKCISTSPTTGVSTIDPNPTPSAAKGTTKSPAEPTAQENAIGVLRWGIELSY